MEMQTLLPAKKYEHQLIGIVHRLPPERVSQVIDFAQFLEFQIAGTQGMDWLDKDESDEAIKQDNARWDALLATDESQHLLERMADEALAEIQAGHARPMVFTEEGAIAPG